MSGLVEKVKEKARRRSSARKSAEYTNGPTTPSTAEKLKADARSSAEYRVKHHPQPIPPSWHISSGGRWTTAESVQQRAQTQDHGQQLHTSLYPGESDQPYDVVPARGSSLQHTRTSHDEGSRSDQGHSHGIAQDYIPQKVIRRKETPQDIVNEQSMENSTAHDGGLSNMISQLSFDPTMHYNEYHPDFDSSRDYKIIKESNEYYNSQVHDHQNRPTNVSQYDSVSDVAAADAFKHIMLPSDFQLRNGETTDVSTEWKPAVTHEVIHQERTEIVRDVITRDIHVHHYYTYIQPVQVVEVLPARHFIIDEESGEKVEVRAPLGWMMPENLQPRQPDYSMLRTTTRHYLVDDEHPHGILEPPPVQNKSDQYHLGRDEFDAQAF